MDAITVTVSKRGYIVLPAGLRKAMEIKPGSKMLISRDDNRLILTSVHSFTDMLSGLTRQPIAKTAQEVTDFIDAERAERDR
jgi:AbrB family looped-hinge helix DNA binding protein